MLFHCKVLVNSTCIIFHIILNFKQNCHILRTIWEEKLREWAVHLSTLITSDSSRSERETQCGIRYITSQCGISYATLKRRNRAIPCLAFWSARWKRKQTVNPQQILKWQTCLLASFILSVSLFLNLWQVVVYSQSRGANKLNSLVLYPCLLESKGQRCEMCLCR